ncbi:hypothetical protein [Cellulomonas triticagri]|uniref:Uncharacterized protein n=1 Tax=Cellulomonas triticagri TaxID=2483352 RepID=A0A3M2IY31_9CELL|nr:hypothetical protein [Cellulomonas triticagri]RMI03725.1 hypothetical protein EBM89_18575 [Cellulomonas triticagri]
MTPDTQGSNLMARVAAEPVLEGFGLDFTWVNGAVGDTLRDLAGGLLAAGLIGCGIAVVLGVVTVVAGKAGLRVSDKAASFASGAVAVGVVAALVLGSVAAAVARYANITLGW